MGIDPLFLAYGDINYELSVTRNMLSRVPNTAFDWRPHQKSWTMGELACHIVDILWWQVATLQDDSIDISQPLPKTKAKTQKELMDAFDSNESKLLAALKHITVNALADPWTLLYGDQVYFTEPRVTVLRRFGISHLIHHRAQLSVYLRMNDISLPPSYGPSADEG